jgi:PAS domain S-box-containing protein
LNLAQNRTLIEQVVDEALFMRVFPHRAKIRPALISWPTARVAFILIEAFLASGFESGPGTSTLILIFLFLLALAIFFKWFFENRQLKLLATRGGDMRLDSEERFRDLVESVDAIVWEANARTLKVTYVSPAAERILGYPPSRWMETPEFWSNHLHPDDRARALECEQKVLATGKPASSEYRMTANDGRTVWFRDFTYLVPGADGQPDRLRGVMMDVNESREADEKVRLSEDRYRDLVEHCRDLICTHDLTGRLLSVNQEPARVLGYSAEQLLNTDMRDLLAPEVRDGFDEYLAKIKRDGAAQGRMVVLTQSGERRIWEYTNTLRTEGVREPVVRGMAMDVTQRLRAERELRQSEERNRIVSSLTSDYTFGVRVNPDGTTEFEWIGETMTRLSGYTLEDLNAKGSLGRMIYPEDFPKLIGVWARVHAGESLQPFEFRGFTKAGDLRWLRAYLEPIWDASHTRIVREIGAIQDVTERKQADGALLALEERFSKAFNAGPEPMTISALPSGEYIDVNETFLRITGYRREEVIGRSASDLKLWIDPDARPKPLAALQSGPVREMEITFATKSGQTRSALLSAEVIEVGGQQCLLAVTKDVTDRKKAEASLLESEERLRSLVQNAPVGIYRTTPEGRIVMVNPALVAMLGCKSLEELLARNLEEQGFEPGYPRQVFRERIEREGGVRGLESAWTRQDGSVIFVRESARVVRGESGEALYYDGVVEDVTERKWAEDALQASELWLRTIFNSQDDAVFVVSPDRVILDVNTGAQRVFGYSAEELKNRSTEILHTDSQHYKEFGRRIQAAFARDEAAHFEFQARRKNGEVFPAEHGVSLLKNDQGKPMGIVSVVRDITERKRAEVQIKASEEKFRKAFMTGADAFYIATLNEGKIIDVNDRFEDVFGYTREEAIGNSALVLGLYAYPADRQKMVSEVKSNGYVRNLEVAARKKGGEPITVLMSANLLQGGDKQIVLGVIRDVTEQKRAEQALVRLRQAVDASGEVVFMTDSAGLITLINPEFTRLYGYTEEEVVGKVTPRILKSGTTQPEDYAIFWKTILGKRVARSEVTNQTKEGQLVSVESSVNPILDEHGNITGFLAIQRDVMHRKQLEEQFRQAQKMEAVGRLAGGVAHDFNNILTVINGYSELMLGQLMSENPHQKYVNEIMKAGERAAGLTRQLLAFSRQQVLEPQVLDLNQAVINVHSMLRRLIGEDIQLVMIPAENLGRVKADPGQMEQVLLNLAVNARDAMPQGGNLSIETANVILDENYTRGDFVVTPGAYVMLAMNDSGMGMDAETKQRIFEPFFTTKEKGKGTGLGLSMVYGVVKQSGGYINVYSEVGYGTTFKIYLPRVDAPIEAPERAGRGVEHSRGNETVLLVEDDAPIRALVRSTLEGHGYTVLEAPDGADALASASLYKDTIHLLVTDLVMPGMSGRSLSERLAISRPEIKILYMSGYTDDAVIRHGGLEMGMAFLQKPFTPDSLARKVREVLDVGQGA